MDAVVVIGGGPAGLMAAQVAAEAGRSVRLLDAMPGIGRKLLVAGSTGLNLTYAEDPVAFAARYGEAATWLRPHLDAFDGAAVRGWAASLGVETFVGSSRRVFPAEFHAAELLKRWLDRLRSLGVELLTGHRWLGWDDAGALRVADASGETAWRPRASVLALGGASWPQTGSDGAWAPLMAARGIALRPLEPANCGFEIDWSPAMARFAGAPLKNVALRCAGATSVGECVITGYGIEGQAIYALGAAPRRAVAAEGAALLELDLKRDLDREQVRSRLAADRGKRSWSEHLRRRLGLAGPSYSLLREAAPDAFDDPAALAAAIKALPLRLQHPRPIAEAISSAGGIDRAELDDGLMLRRLPGTFACGEMLDWEAPTGGFLLTACLATGRTAGAAAARYRPGGGDP